MVSSPLGNQNHMEKKGALDLREPHRQCERLLELLCVVDQGGSISGS